MESSSKTVLITGAGGFIGSNIVNEFLNNGFKIYAIIHNYVPEKFKNNKQIELIKCDVTDAEEVSSVFKKLQQKPKIIVHAAGLASDVGADKLFRKLNFESVKIMAQLPCKRFIYISSTDVYGIKDFNGESEEELTLLEYPKNPYPKYKIKSEMWLRENISPEKYIIIRPAAVWGNGDKTLEKRFVAFLKVSPFIVHFGDWQGKNRWPLANVKTLAKVVFYSCLTDKYTGQAINIIDTKKTTIDEYYRELGAKYFPDKKFKTIILPMWIGKTIGVISTVLSRILKTKYPIFDPSYYALHHVSSNLNFDNRKMKSVMRIKDLNLLLQESEVTEKQKKRP